MALVQQKRRGPPSPRKSDCSCEARCLNQKSLGALGGIGSDVLISTSEAARYSARLLDGGKRLLVDISDADVAFADGAISDRTGVVAGVLTQAFRQDGSSIVRVAVTLAEHVTYRIRP